MVFATHWHESAMDLHVFPILNPLSPPSPSHPSMPSQCTSPKHLSRASNLNWRSVSHLIMYMFQCYSLRSSHPRLLPWSPKVCSIHLCLFFCLAYRVIVTIFLNSIYMHGHTVLVFFFLAYFTLYNGLQFHPPHLNWFKWILFNGWVIVHHVYVPQLSYPLVCWWASRLLTLNFLKVVIIFVLKVHTSQLSKRFKENIKL